MDKNISTKNVRQKTGLTKYIWTKNARQEIFYFLICSTKKFDRKYFVKKKIF